MIFFDIDATLLDHEQAEKLGARAFYRLHSANLQLNEEDFILQWNRYSELYFEKFLANELTYQEQRRMRIKALFGCHLGSEECDQIFDDYLKLYQDNWSIFEDVVPCLDSLKNSDQSLGIISNGKYLQQLEKLKRTGIVEYFDIIVTSSEVGEAKPTPIIFLEACKKANVLVSESYYVGDRLETDAIGSFNTGMKGIWLDRTNGKRKLTCPDIKVIHSLNELGELLI